METRTLRALLDGLIDYAGLFPPAGLSMADAVARYADYRDRPHAWMLGRFVVPCGRLTELEHAAASFATRERPWPLATLAGADLSADLEALTRFRAAHEGAGGLGGPRSANSGRFVVASLDVKIAGAADVERVSAVLPRDVDLWLEVTPLPARGPAPEPDPDLAATLEAIQRAGHGAKLRTGGVVPELIPSAATVACFLVAALRAGVRSKATAGLHHPVRSRQALTYEADSPRAVMHGFLNVFLAAALGRARLAQGASAEDVEAALVDLLEEEDPRAFVFTDDEWRWREYRLDRAALTEGRQAAAVSFGSCSFEEPLTDLAALGWLDVRAGVTGAAAG